MGKVGPHVKELFDISGRVAMITGGCQNLGLQMAEALGEAGAELVITSRDEEKAKRAAEELASELGVRVMPLGLDVTDEESVEAGFRRVMDEYGRLDILVCNAGGGRISGGSPVTDERLVSDWDYTIAVNLRGTFLCCRYACRIMKQQSNGSIINIGSISGKIGRDRWVYEDSDPPMQPNLTDYTAAKGGIIAFTKDLAAEMAEHGIRVNSISPGGFERGQPEEFIRRYNKQTMLKRMGRDGVDLKGAVVYLASAAADYVTAHELGVAGGLTSW